MRRLSDVRGWIKWILLAFVCMQTLTVVHRVMHAESLSRHIAQTTQQALAADQKPTDSLTNDSHTTPFYADLWNEHKTSSDCQLYDQACTEVLHQSLPVDTFIPPLTIWIAIVLLERFALFERFYSVRGPPVLI